MASTISGSNAISNLSGSDTDFDTVLANLKKVESTQLNRLEAWKSDWKLRYDAFDAVIEQVSTASNVLANLANKNSFVTKNVTSSDSNIISAVASASADDIQHTINVTQVASNAIWANTGHVFSSKTDIINTSGTSQTFSYSYAGKEYSMAVPANTTLDSFVSMVNNSSDNPGIKVSIVQASSGYVFQVAGKSTGADNDLVIHSSDLVGMSASGTTSTWTSNSVLDMGSTLSNPTKFAYDLIMEDGNTFSVKIDGDKTNSDLATAINAQVGRSIASIDSSGNLQLTDVKAMYRRDTSTQTSFSTPVTKFSMGSSPTTTTLSGDLTVDLNINDGVTTGTRTLTIAAGTTMKDAALQIAQASGASTAEMTYNSTTGGWELNLTNVNGATLTFADSASDSGKMTSTVIADETKLGTKVLDDSGSQSFTASTAVTFDSTKLSQKLGGTSADGSKNFTYTIVDNTGATQTLTIAQDATYQDLLTQLEPYGTLSADGKTVTLANTEKFYLSAGGTGGGMDGITVKTDATATITSMDAASTLETPPALTYTYTDNTNSTAQTFSIPGGSSMADVIAELKSKGLSGSLVSADGATTIDLQTGTLPTTGSYYLKLDNIDTLSGPGITGQVTSSSNWNIRSAANAKFTVDNWPLTMESATNSVSDVIDGVVFTIQDKGSASITVSTDITSVETSIQTFLDSVNSILMTINEYTKYDADKETTTNDPNNTSSDNYSTSQLTTEKGGLLQGNYGVQLFKSRFTALVNSAPPGFASRTSASDVLSGDVLANLANMGIKVETDQSSSNYGLLVIGPTSGIAELQELDKSNYEDMINNNLSDVVDFFCSSGTGTSTSADFRYGSHISGITKGGSYDVTYSVDAGGNITNVMVGGVEATRDTSQPGYYYSVASGDARGLSLQIDNLTPGDHSGQIRIKEGLVQTVSTFLKSELTYTAVNISSGATEEQTSAAIALKSKNGALMVLKNNYQSIMENIDKKITKEQARLELWESRQKTYFANLETLLKQYNTQQDQLTAQLENLANSTSSS